MSPEIFDDERKLAGLARCVILGLDALKNEANPLRSKYGNDTVASKIMTHLEELDVVLTGLIRAHGMDRP
jgi:hypothetical protein